MDSRYDLNVLLEAEDIRKNPGRMRKAKAYADEQSERMQEVSGRLFGKPGTKAFNGAVKNSKMRK